MSKINVKDYLDGDEIDLSLQSITTATLPIKELVVIKKAKKLDLSKNQIIRLPESFVSSMGHLVKIDLSGNGLEELPLNIGNMGLLQHLDLFNNKLSVLPLSIYKLKSLKWLDVKENPDLDYPPESITGLCRNDNECKTCAVEVVQFMKKENADEEKARQKNLEAKRVQKEALKVELERLEELELLEKRRIKQEEKAREKARRRAEYEERMRSQPAAPATREPTPRRQAPTKQRPVKQSTSGTGRNVIGSICIVLAVVGVALLFLDPSVQLHLNVVKGAAQDTLRSLNAHFNHVIQSVDKQLQQSAPGIQKSLSSAALLVNQMMVICTDTLILAYELAKQEFTSLSTFIRKSYSS